MSPAPPKGAESRMRPQASPKALPPALCLSPVAEGYVTRERGEPGVLPKASAAVNQFLLPSFSQQESALCRLDLGAFPGCFCFI